MRLSSFILGTAFCFAATLAQAAGLRFIEVPSDAEGAMSGAVWYPCAAPAEELTLHGVALTGVMDWPAPGQEKCDLRRLAGEAQL